MKALTTPEARVRHIRRWAWMAAPFIAFPLSCGLTLLREPEAPYWLGLVIGLVATPITGALMSKGLASAVGDLLVLRLGKLDAVRARLAESGSRFAPATSRAALALEAGELASATGFLSTLKAVDRTQPLFHLVTQRMAFLTGDPAKQHLAIAALLAWRPRLRIGVHAEIARYHAFVLAMSLVTRAPDDPSVVAAVKRLRDDRDFEIRAYATWLSSGDDDAELLLAGAALARAVGREPVAQSLELRAARLATDLKAPYRAG